MAAVAPQPSPQTSPRTAAGKSRSFGPRLIGVAVSRLTRPLLGKHGFTAGAVITDWEAIVGRELAAYAAPTKVAFARGERADGVLHVRTAGGAFATEIQHRAPILIERINTYFGYRAVARIKITQGPLPKRAPPPKSWLRPLDEGEQASLDAEVATVEDGDLRDALARLGRAVIGGKSS